MHTINFVKPQHQFVISNVVLRLLHMQHHLQNLHQCNWQLRTAQIVHSSLAALDGKFGAEAESRPNMTRLFR